MSMIHANVPLVNKNIYNWFVKPICFAAPNGVATHSLTSPVIEDAAGCLSKDGSQKKHLSQRLCHHLIKKKRIENQEQFSATCIYTIWRNGRFAWILQFINYKIYCYLSVKTVTFGRTNFIQLLFVY